MPNTDPDLDDDMREEYDLTKLTGAVQGKYAERFKEGTNLVLVDPDLAAVFPDSEAVNRALRMLLEVAVRARQVG
jgi:hypothetical protein